MDVVKTILMILFAIDCIVLTVLVLLQEGKASGLGALTGSSDTYWAQNKGRSKEGKLVLVTRVAAILFLVFALALNLFS